MRPRSTWSGTAAADACAHGSHCQVGGFLQFPNGDIRWFSERWSVTDFQALDIPVNNDSQKDISSYELLAQICLVYCFIHLKPGQRLGITIRSWSDNTGAEATGNTLFTTTFPLCLFAERLCILSSLAHAELDISHISGASNDLADAISRWNMDRLPPHGLRLSDRIRIQLSSIWNPKPEFQIYPTGSTVSWPLPSVG